MDLQETAGSKKPKMFYSMAIERSAQHTGNGPQAVKKTYSEFLALRYACHPSLNLTSCQQLSSKTVLARNPKSGDCLTSCQQLCSKALELSCLRRAEPLTGSMSSYL